MTADLKLFERTGIFEFCNHCKALVELWYSRNQDTFVGAPHTYKKSYLDDSVPYSFIGSITPKPNRCPIWKFEDFRTENYRKAIYALKVISK